MNFQEGETLLFDKPLKWTSFQVVNKVRWLIKQATGKKIKVGHAGTLDPLATGLLILCTGRSTKKIEQYQAEEKEYTGTFVLGATTPCFDMEKEIDQTYPIEHITNEMVVNAAQSFVGNQEQVPPLFSAVKIKGERAYEKARRGEQTEVKAKSIEIKTFEVTAIRMPEVDFKIVCSKGTYIRSIARDLGQKLDSGAYLKKLTRTRIGEYDLNKAMSIELFEQSLRKDPSPKGHNL